LVVLQLDRRSPPAAKPGPSFEDESTMNRKKILSFFGLSLALTIATLTACQSGSSVSHEQTESSSSALWTNGSFETGDAGSSPPGWTVTPYINPAVTITSPQTRAGLNLQNGGSPFTQELYASGGAESQPDPSLGSSASLRWPKYGKQVAIVNQLGKNGNVNSLSQTMTIAAGDVDPSDGQIHVRFVVAPVLENPNHVAAEQPYYFVQLTNLTRNNIMYVDYNASAQPGVPWKISNGYYYTDWQLVDIAPGSAQLAIGDQVKLEVIAAGCSPGGHFGEVYVDGIGATIPGLFVTATGPTAANAGSNITYTLTYQNGGTTAVAGTTVAFNTPSSTTYQSISAPGLTCSTPVVGTGGLVTCTVGSLAAGASGSFQVTTQIAASATGTITEGNYSIYGTSVSPLLGPKVYTTVTNGITYADLQVAASDNANGVIWGQSLTYTITVTNPTGPNAVTGATVTDTFPATLKNISWTCVGANGAACTASGTGNIADGSVNIPVGGSATYTVNATVVSGTGAGQVANIASVTLPAAAVDFYPLNNAAGVYNAISSPNGTACGTALDCASGVCDVAGGICIPAGGCGADSDCAGTPNTWCNTQTFACVAKLANGSAIPTVSGHTPSLTGSCSAQAGAAVCLSAVCDATDNACGYLDGDGSCTALTANVCRSGACSANGKCEPSGGCNVDADCAPGNWCNESTNVCTPKVANGAALPSDAAHDSVTLNGQCTANAALVVCQSGVCDSDDKCGYANGDGACTSLTASNVCRSGACDMHDLKCGYVNGDGPCSGNGALCRSNVCDIDGNCGYANGDGSCTSGNATTVCRSQVCASSGPLAGSCEQCGSDLSCSGSTPACDVTKATCEQCTASNASACGGTTPVCNLATETCGGCNGDNGSGGTLACPSTANPYCASSGALAGSCGKCTSNADCAGTHNGPICDLTSGACGTVCAVDGDCGSSQWCDSGTCTNKTANGQLLPSDAPISGSCTPANAQRVCASGVCDSDNKCGLANGSGACTALNASNVCRSQVCTTAAGSHFDTCEACNSDSDCHDPSKPACDTSTNTCVQCSPTNASACTGASPICNATTETCVGCGGDNGSSAAAACQSAAAPYCTSTGACGLCTTNNDCVGAHQGPICDPVSGSCGTVCRHDADCGNASEWCNAAAGSTGSCVPKLDNGTLLPAAPADVATCSPSVGSRVCASGLCDTADNKCGLANGDPCTAASQCRIAACTAGFCAFSTIGSPDGGADGGSSNDGGTWIDGGESPSDDAQSNDVGATGNGDVGSSANDDGGSLAGGGCSASPARTGDKSSSACVLLFGLALLGIRRRRNASRRD
jgi:uncharacterized repeat protein (TIGR01451 family)